MRPRAKVKPEFIELVCDVAREKLESIHQEAQCYSDRACFLETKGEIITRLGGLVRRNPIAIDRLKTNLRGLNYQSFSIYEKNDIQYLIGKTNSVVVEQYSSSTVERPHKFFDAGTYWVYLRTDHFLGENLDKIQMIPERNPSTEYRHPHIWANKEDHSSPLDFTPKICWSGFAQLVSGAAEDHDIVALFRYIYLHLSRWAVGSEWGGCKHISFIENYPLENPNAH